MASGKSEGRRSLQSKDADYGIYAKDHRQVFMDSGSHFAISPTRSRDLEKLLHVPAIRRAYNAAICPGLFEPLRAFMLPVVAITMHSRITLSIR